VLSVLVPALEPEPAGSELCVDALAAEASLFAASLPDAEDELPLLLLVTGLLEDVVLPVAAGLALAVRPAEAVLVRRALELLSAGS